MKRQTLITDLKKLIGGDESFKRIPPPRREAARNALELGKSLARHAAAEGGRYSGTYFIEGDFGEVCQAETRTSRGSRYSRSCTYYQTNTSHHVRVTPDGVIDLVGEDALIEASDRDGLPLIAYKKATGAAVWVRVCGKKLVLTNGFVAHEGRDCFHSTKSLVHAQKGLDQKQKVARQVVERAAAEKKGYRRARLVARLCGGAIATIADAMALGFCEPGIRAFQAKFGIGDASGLPDLIRTGNPLAIQLALSVARGVHRAA